MSRVMVLSDGVIDILIKSKEPIDTFFNVPKTTVLKGCGCAGKPKTPTEVTDYNTIRLNLLNSPNDLAATKTYLKIDTLVMFVKENGTLVRKTV